MAVVFENCQDCGGEVEDQPTAVLCPVWRESRAAACEALHSSLTHDALPLEREGTGLVIAQINRCWSAPYSATLKWMPAEERGADQ
ncbi:hypothetical protein NDU88_005424 [Pleurodeles waltl]|uniref:Uncharacterized protein n=1 Tax=Pleurodeles waltl TaxID=8319 RepID=A0AAV7WBG8_PLEWA|nr:hypothetical protein NDU88_005424 [Pleurodeles waltl]